MKLWKKIRGTIEDIFQIGLNGGINLKNVGGVLEIKNEGDSALVVIRSAQPVGDNDVATKKFVETINGFNIVVEQANTSVAIPTNTVVKRNLVVTTGGNGASIGDLLFDDGSGSGAMEIIVASTNRTIAVSKALTGGTVSFDADSINTWDADDSTWTKIGDIGSVTGAVRTIRYEIGNTATQDSTSIIPLGARVLSSKLEITTSYSGGATINIGTTTDVDAFQDGVNAPKDNNPQGAINNVYELDGSDIAVASASVVRTTIAGSPAVAAGIVTILYTVANS